MKEHDSIIADDTGWKEDQHQHHRGKKWCRFIKFRVENLEPEQLKLVKLALMREKDYPGADDVYAIPDFTKSGCWLFLA